MFSLFFFLIAFSLVFYFLCFFVVFFLISRAHPEDFRCYIALFLWWWQRKAGPNGLVDLCNVSESVCTVVRHTTLKTHTHYTHTHTEPYMISAPAFSWYFQHRSFFFFKWTVCARPRKNEASSPHHYPIQYSPYHLHMITKHIWNYKMFFCLCIFFFTMSKTKNDAKCAADFQLRQTFVSSSLFRFIGITSMKMARVAYITVLYKQKKIFVIVYVYR